MTKRSSKRKATATRHGVATETDDKQHVCLGRAPHLGSVSKKSEGGKVRRISARMISSIATTEEISPWKLPERLPSQRHVNSSSRYDRKYVKVLNRLPRPDNGPNPCSPKSSVTAYHVCRQLAKAHRWCLRSLRCGSIPEEIARNGPAPASVDVHEPVSGVGTDRPDQDRVQDSSTTTTRNDLGVSTKSSKNLTVSRKPQRVNFSAQSPPVVTTTAPSTSLASDRVAHSSQSHRSSDKQFSESGANVHPQAQIHYDPFSSMRLNIDNMSYEELLALQERIGYVSTGLSEEELIKSRKIATYKVKRRRTTKHKDADSKCSICQEEYQSGDRMGSLKCKHSYHAMCIDEWLRQKNWCPTCKAGVGTSV